MIRYDAADYWIQELVFAADGRELITVWSEDNKRGEFTLWDWLDGRALRRLAAPDVGVSAGGEFVALHDPSAPEVRVHRVRDPEPAAVVPWAGEGWAKPAVTRDGSELAVMDVDWLCFYRLPDGAEHARKPRGSLSSPRYSPGGRWLYGRSHEAVRFWDRQNKLRVVRLPAATYTAVDVGGDDRTAAVVGPRMEVATVWDVTTRTELAKLTGHDQRVGVVAVSPDGRRVLTGSVDRTARLWDVDTGECLRVFDWDVGAVTALAFAPDGLTAAAGGEKGQVVVWDLDG